MTDPAPSVQPVRAWAVVDKDGLNACYISTFETKERAHRHAESWDRLRKDLAPHRVIRVEIREVNDE